MTYEVSEKEVKDYGTDKFFVYWTIMFVLITLVKYDKLISTRLYDYLILEGYTVVATDLVVFLTETLLWTCYIVISLKFIMYVAKFMFSYKFDTEYNKTFFGYADEDACLTVKEPFSKTAYIIDKGAVKKVTYAKYRQGVYVYVYMKKGGTTRVVESILTPKSFSELVSFLENESVSVTERRMFGCRYLVGLFVGVFHKTV